MEHKAVNEPLTDVADIRMEGGIEAYGDGYLAGILRRTRSVAVVGFSANPERPSFRVAQYLSENGYRVIPVNPGLVGQVFFGEPVRASLADIEGPVDMVDVFRRSDAVPEVVEAALAQFGDLGTIWLQLGVMHAGAAAQARARGVDVVQDRCPKIEHARLLQG